MIPINESKIAKIYDKLSALSWEYKENDAYVKGKNPGIYKERSKSKPDNRLPLPFAKMAVDDMCGYAGRSQDIIISFDEIAVDEKESVLEETYRALIRNWMDYNSDGIDTAELYREALSQGKSYQLWWTTENNEPGLPAKPEYKIVHGDQIYIKWSDELKPIKEYAVRFWVTEDETNDTKVLNAMAYYPFYAEAWTRVNDIWSRDSEKDIKYPYTVVPVIEYKINKDKLPLFEAEKPIIDQIDKIVSKSINEVDRFNALILLLPALADAGFVSKLTELKVIDDLDRFTKNPEFLAKDLEGVTEFYKWIEDLLEKTYRKSIKIPDMTSETFGGTDESGVARAFKMLGMEFVASQIETYFIPGIYERKQMFDDVIKAGTITLDTSVLTINVKTKRNLPIDEKAKMELAILMKNIGISDETIYKMLPSSIIEDVDKELSQKEAEGLDTLDLMSNQISDKQDTE